MASVPLKPKPSDPPAPQAHTLPPQGMLTLLERLLDDLRESRVQMAPTQGRIPVEQYLSAARCERETQVLFRQFPLLVAHVSELPEPGMCLPLDVAGQPVVLTRDLEGRVRAFLNVCRHRGMQLQSGNEACQRRTLVCPYHGWTYELDGRLRHVPHPEFFPDVDTASVGLVELPCAIASGMVLVRPSPGEPFDAADWLGGIGQDFTFLGFADSVLYRKVDVLRQCNWKLIIDAFLEAYHIKVLHRDSIYPFFMDATAANVSEGRHIRSVIARRRLQETLTLPPEQWNLREHCSFSHYVFPNSISVHHPDYSSLLTFYPQGPDHMRWIHHMLIPRARHTQAEAAHWENTFRLIEETVFQREDLFVAEGMHKGLRSGANRDMTLGRTEYSLMQFHQQIQDALDQYA